jgi:hypothetical protein
MTTKIDWAALFSTRGSVRLEPQQLCEVAEGCRVRNVMVHTVEAFEIRGDAEIVRTDLALFGPAEDTAHRPWGERVQIACDEARAVAESALGSGKTIVFQVWLDQV